MAKILRVPATVFSRSFARYQDEALSEKIIEVTSHGRVIGGYLSASELEHYKSLKRREREVLIVGELDEDTISDIENAQYGVAPK
ncbi:conserved hypothetical protein (plasmid) [Rhizobium leguminosarum bv. trifolii WSM2304]|uniref:Prevent-host-death protein n=1 Tax=Rhizobium leguminosarum bv. trifolii (strain WSM2304) TaxID=395492 RepID=A0ABF7QX07_RHILW|nr:hypothetical protein [Rhizobium leguminosarum]ACI58560.1 conserved hypothetical protein [Rhizobium leguminosarum bv. trifolii WSM2304]